MHDKHTAIDWLEEAFNTILTDEQQMQVIGLFIQAKEMEKEQMRLADKNGQNRNQYKHDCEYGGVEYWDNEPKPFDEYYNETYNIKQK